MCHHHEKFGKLCSKWLRHKSWFGSTKDEGAGKQTWSCCSKKSEIRTLMFCMSHVECGSVKGFSSCSLGRTTVPCHISPNAAWGIIHFGVGCGAKETRDSSLQLPKAVLEFYCLVFRKFSVTDLAKFLALVNIPQVWPLLEYLESWFREEHA